MEPVAVKSLIASLFAWLHTVTGYAIPPEPPRLVFKPQAELARQACEGPCPIRAWSPVEPPDVIYLAEGLDVAGDVCERAVLVHELAHHMQRHVGAYEGFGENATGHMREMEALRLQNVYLEAHGRKLLHGHEFGVANLTGPYC